MLRRTLAIAVLALSFGVAPTDAAVIVRPAGPISDVAAGDGEIAWLRCAAGGRLQQIWALSGAAPATKLLGLGAGADCVESDLLGIAADRLVVDFTDWGYRDWIPRSLLLLGLDDGSVRTLDANRPATIFLDGDRHHLDAPALAGGSVTWWQSRTGEPDRLMLAPLRGPGDPSPAGERTGLVGGTWYNRRGDALLLERERGSWVTRERLILRTADGRERTVASVSTGTILGADLNDRWLTFTTRRPQTHTTPAPSARRIHAWRLDPLAPVATWPVSLNGDEHPKARDVGIGRLAGDTLLWATHAAWGASVRDGIRAARLPGDVAPWIWSIRTRSDRGVWVTRPAIRGRSAIFAITRFPPGNTGRVEPGLRVRSRLISLPVGARR